MKNFWKYRRTGWMDFAEQCPPDHHIMQALWLLYYRNIVSVDIQSNIPVDNIRVVCCQVIIGVLDSVDTDIINSSTKTSVI